MQVEIIKDCSIDGAKYKKGSLTEVSHFNAYCMQIVKEVPTPNKKSGKKPKKTKKLTK